MASLVAHMVESARNAGDRGLIPGLGRSPGGGNGNPLQDSCLENPMDTGGWWATVHGVTKSWTWLSGTHTHTHTHIFLEWRPLKKTPKTKTLNSETCPARTLDLSVCILVKSPTTSWKGLSFFPLKLLSCFGSFKNILSLMWWEQIVKAGLLYLQISLFGQTERLAVPSFFSDTMLVYEIQNSGWYWPGITSLLPRHPSSTRNPSAPLFNYYSSLNWPF